MTGKTWLLGIDGGGTKTDAWLALETDEGQIQIVGRGRAGSANLRSIGFERTTGNLAKAIDDAFQVAGTPRHTVNAACLALAGMDRDAERRSVRTWADQSNLADRLQLTHDAEPILASGTEQGIGVALISGTGSFAFGRNQNGESARSGGWGYRFGDEGSAYAIATDGLRAATRSADGRGPTTTLLPLFQQRLQVNAPLELIEALYDEHVDRRAIAKLAPLVLEAANAGDGVAQRLIDNAAFNLYEMVAALVQRLQLPIDNLPLALAGSLILNSPLLERAMLNHLRDQQGMSPQVRKVAEPVRGAVQLALQLVQRPT